MSNSGECGAYFRQQKELKRLFDEMRKKWQSYGRCAGTICLKNCSGEERKALERMLGQTFWEADVKITLNQVEKALQDTRFAPITLEELLEAYFREKIVTNSNKRQEKMRQREAFFHQVQQYFRQRGAHGVCQWYQRMQEERRYGYAVLNREQENSEKNAFLLAKYVGEALAWTQDNIRGDIPVAVLSAKITGNPHYFDRGTPAGTLLIHSLCFSQSREYPASAYEWKELLTAAGILPDDVASMVITYGVHLRKNGDLHPGPEAFYHLQEPLTLTSMNLMGCELALGENGRAFIVENEMVFRYLYEKVRRQNITLLCTSGQMRTAALELIRLLVQGKTEIYYSGDIDPEGLGIADRIWQRYPENIRIWRMSPDDYKRGLSEEMLESRSMSQLDTIQNPGLAQTALCLKETKKAAYQENLLRELLGDLSEGQPLRA